MTTFPRLPAAEQGHQRRRSRCQAGHELRLMAAGANRRLRVVVCNRPEQAGSLSAHVKQDQVGGLEALVGAPISERGDGCNDQRAIFLPQRLAIDPGVCRIADDDDGAACHDAETTAVLRPGQVQGDPEFVQVQRQEQAALFGVRQVRRKWTRMSCRVALWRFHLDDLGPQ